MAIWPEAQMNKVENRWKAGDFRESSAIGLGPGFEVGRFHRHAVHLIGAQRNPFEQAFASE